MDNWRGGICRILRFPSFNIVCRIGAKLMIKYILKKLLQMIPMLLVISLIVFLGLRATGVDPILPIW